MTCPNVRAALELLEIEGVLLPEEHPQYAEALALAARFRLVQHRRGPGGPSRYHLTPRGHRWLAEGWELVSSRDVAEQRTEAVRVALQSGDFDAGALAQRLGVSRRRVNQIRARLLRS